MDNKEIQASYQKNFKSSISIEYIQSDKVDYIYLCMYAQSFNFSNFFVTPWTVAHQAPLSMRISQAGILEWVAIFFSRACYSGLNLHPLSLALAAKSFQSCPTLCDPIDGSPPGSPVPGILQASTLEWVAISFSNAWKWKVKVKSLGHVRPLVTPWTAAHQAPRPWDFPGKSTGVGCHCLHWQADSLPLGHERSPIL